MKPIKEVQYIELLSSAKSKFGLPFDGKLRDSTFQVQLCTYREQDIDHTKMPLLAKIYQTIAYISFLLVIEFILFGTSVVLLAKMFLATDILGPFS